MEDNKKISSLLKMIDIRIRQDLDARNEDMQISSMQMQVLHYLCAHTDREINPSDIGRCFRISKPTVAGVLRRLEEKGFLHFCESAKDNRYKQIVLDDKAFQCIARLRDNFARMEHKLYAGLTEEQIDQLRSLLLHLLANMAKKEEEVM